MELIVDRVEVVTRWYKHPRRRWIYINPVTEEEFIKRWISIDGHLTTNWFPFWVAADIKYPLPPPEYSECRKADSPAVLTAPFSANFHVLVAAFDDRAYSYGRIGKEYLLVPLEGLYDIAMQASWLPWGIRVAASDSVIMDADTRGREDKITGPGAIPPNIIYAEAEGESRYAQD